MLGMEPECETISPQAIEKVGFPVWKQFELPARPDQALARLPMARTQGPIYEYACNEDNYGMANNLSAARAEEKDAAEAARKESK